MTARDRQYAIDNVRERLDALLRFAVDAAITGEHEHFQRYNAKAPEHIVDAVLALTRPDRERFPWPTARGPARTADTLTQIERLR